MVDKIEITVTDLSKKHSGKPGYENMYSVAKHVYMDNGEIDTIGFTIDKRNFRGHYENTYIFIPALSK